MLDFGYSSDWGDFHALEGNLPAFTFIQKPYVFPSSSVALGQHGKEKWNFASIWRKNEL